MVTIKTNMESITLDENQMQMIVDAADFVNEEAIQEDAIHVLHSREHGNIEIVRSCNDYFFTL